MKYERQMGANGALGHSHFREHSSTTDSVAALASNSSAPMSPSGATPVAPPFLSPLPTSAH